MAYLHTAYEGVAQQAQLGLKMVAWAVTEDVLPFWEAPGPPGGNGNCYWHIRGAS